MPQWLMHSSDWTDQAQKKNGSLLRFLIQNENGGSIGPLIKMKPEGLKREEKRRVKATPSSFDFSNEETEDKKKEIQGERGQNERKEERKGGRKEGRKEGRKDGREAGVESKNVLLTSQRRRRIHT